MCEIQGSADNDGDNLKTDGAADRMERAEKTWRCRATFVLAHRQLMIRYAEFSLNVASLVCTQYLSTVYLYSAVLVLVQYS